MVRFLLFVSLLASGGCHLIFPFETTEPGSGSDAAGLDGGPHDAALDGKLHRDGLPREAGPPREAGSPKEAGLPPDKGPKVDTKPHDKGPPQDSPQPLEAAPPPPCGSWTPVPGPPTTSSTNYLNAVWCSSSGLFVAGDFGKAFRLSGGKWTSLAPPNVNIEALWASSTNNLYAVAGDKILHYNGSTWKTDQPAKGIGLHGLWGSAPNDIYAVGSSGTILRYDGSNWKQQNSSASVGVILHGVWGSGANDVYAVGTKGTILHFNGTAWQPAASAGSLVEFKDVWGSGPNDVYAVGSKVYHRDSSSWKPQAGPGVYLDAVWGLGNGCVYAAGNSGQIWFRNSSSGWTKMSSQTSFGLMDIHSCSAGTYVVGRVNTVLRLK